MPLPGGRWPVLDPSSRNLWWNQRAQQQAQQQALVGSQDYLSNALEMSNGQNMGASTGRMYWYPSPMARMEIKEARAWCEVSNAGAELAVAFYSIGGTTNEFKIVPHSEIVFDGSSTGIITHTFLPTKEMVLEPTRGYMVAVMSNDSTARWRGPGTFHLGIKYYAIPYNSDYKFPSVISLDADKLTAASHVGLAGISLVTKRGTKYI